MTNYLITGSSGLIANEIIKLLSSDDNAKSSVSLGQFYAQTSH